MSQIITSQPRNPLTATYFIVGISLAYVLLWNISPPDLLIKISLISVIGGIITSFVYYIELFQRLGNSLLESWYTIAVRRHFPDYRDINYSKTFEEPYFEGDRNKSYGSFYLLVAIGIALTFSPISLPLEILILAIGGCIFLMGAWLSLARKQVKRIKEIHYILTLERHSSTDTEHIVEKVKNELIANRWTSAMTLIKKAKEKFYDFLKEFPRELFEYREKWKKAQFTFYDIEVPFGSNSSISSEIRRYRDHFSSRIEHWLYVLNSKVYDLHSKINGLIEFLQNKVKEELASLLSDSKRVIIFQVISDIKGKLSRIYDNETFALTDDNNIRRLREEITETIKKRSETEPIPSENDVKEAILKFRELRPVFESVVEKIEEVKSCLNKLKLEKGYPLNTQTKNSFS